MITRLTNEKFIEKANLVHNNQYTYSKCNYINPKTKVVITCHFHGEFNQLPYNHLSGKGCCKCATNKRTMSLLEFVEKSIAIWGVGKFDYSKVIYKKNYIHVLLGCLADITHGYFSITPGHHLTGRGCPKCNRTCKLNTVEFIKKAILKHGNKFGYDEVNYINSKTKVKIRCVLNLEHGIFEQKPNQHLLGKGCPKCANRDVTTEEFIKKANLVHNNFYSYENVIYISHATKVKITCPKHGEFEQIPNSHLSGSGCSHCNRVVSKQEVAWLNYLNIDSNLRNKTLHIDNKVYKVDAVDLEKKIVWEFYGDYWHGNPNKYDHDRIHPSRYRVTFGDLYLETLQREKILRDAGYTIVSIWEEEWNKIIESHNLND